MTPSARIQAAIDLLDAIIASARDGGPAADTLIARYFKERRYAGSRDRRAVRDHVYDAIRRVAERPETGREAMIGLAQERPQIAALFDGSAHAPLPIEPGEVGVSAGAVPGWLRPLLAAPVEQDALLGRAPVDLRVNRLKAAPADAAPMLPEAAPIAGLADGLRLPEGWPVEQSAAWKDGLVEVQDAGSQWIAAACGARPGMTVVDMCAGAGGKTLALATDLESGVTREGMEEGRFVNRYDPPRRLLIVGAVQIAQSLVPLAQAIGVTPVVIDPRGRFLTEERFPGVELDDRWPDEAVAARLPGESTAIVTLSHDIKIDDPALVAALRAPTGYVAALGSRRSHAARLERLGAMGFSAEDLARIDGPAGLDIGAVGAAEIALSITAGMVAGFNVKR